MTANSVLLLAAPGSYFANSALKQASITHGGLSFKTVQFGFLLMEAFLSLSDCCLTLSMEVLMF